MTTAIQKTEQTALTNAAQERFFSEEQERIIRESFLNGASRQEAAVLMEVARLRKLSPITRQIHFVKRWDNQRGCEVWAHQVSIDGLRAIAERTGKYDGQDEPEYTWRKDGKPECAKVRVYRKDIGRPFVGVAYWDEYVQTKKDGQPNNMWGKYPRLMLAKCAEALAFRKAFPEDLSGLYTEDEEMGESGADSAAHPPVVRPPVVKPPVVKSAEKATTAAETQPPAATKPVEVPAAAVRVEDAPHDAETGEVPLHPDAAQVIALCAQIESREQAAQVATMLAAIVDSIPVPDAETAFAALAEKCGTLDGLNAVCALVPAIRTGSKSAAYGALRGVYDKRVRALKAGVGVGS